MSDPEWAQDTTGEESLVAIEATEETGNTRAADPAEDLEGAQNRILARMSVAEILIERGQLTDSALEAVVAQRLVRLLSPECKVPHRPTKAELTFLRLERSDLDGIELYGPGGCDRCASSGYRGRTAIHEVLVPGGEFREAILEQPTALRLREMARGLPEFLTMQEDGLLKALSGITTFSEVIENAPRDTSSRPVKQVKSIARTRRSS